MFKLTVAIETFSLTGLEALDARRALGLPDAARLHAGSGNGAVADVPESFARASGAFGSSDTHAVVYLPWHAFSPGDVLIRENNLGLALREMSPARAMELFYAAELRRLRKEIAWVEEGAQRLKKEIAALTKEG